MARVAAGQDGGLPEAEIRAFLLALQVKTTDNSCAFRFSQVANVLFICHLRMHFDLSGALQRGTWLFPAWKAPDLEYDAG